MTTPLAFALNGVEMVNHYRRIWELLPEGSFTVVAGNERVRSDLAQRGIDAPTVAELHRSGTRFRHLVSHHPHLAEQPIEPLADHHTRMMYGLGKAGWNLRSWNQLYDVILCYGPAHREALAQVTDSIVVEVGYPRFDSFFHGAFDRHDVLRRHGADPDRQTVVWLPTWGGLSSVPGHADAVGRLATEANVLVKVHPEFTGYQPDETALLRSLPFTAVIDESIDNVSLFSVADVVLADYGGSMFGALYCDLPLVLLDVPGAEQNENMVAESPDLLVRSVLPTVQPGDADGLAAAVRDVAGHDQAEVRARLRPLLFAPFHGCASEVAAAAIGRLDTLASMRRRSATVGAAR